MRERCTFYQKIAFATNKSYLGLLFLFALRDRVILLHTKMSLVCVDFIPGDGMYLNANVKLTV